MHHYSPARPAVGRSATSHSPILRCALVLALLPAGTAWAAEALTGFDNLSNGFVSQAQFEADLEIFDEREGIADGLGPIYNAQSCAECHQNPVSGGSSQIVEVRAARFVGGSYSDEAGGSLIGSRAIHASLQERISDNSNVRTGRTSLSVLGDGYVEAISDATLADIRAAQHPSVRGTLIQVPVLEAPGLTRAGRFGWKNQHASLLSFSADAYLNEMGITSPLFPTEQTANGRSVALFDTVADPEEAATASEPFGPDVEIFARFMRATRAPEPAAEISGSAAMTGAALFDFVGCAACHTPSIRTAPVNTVLNGGHFVVSSALGDKLIHPYGDFLLHDIGTGDGIIQNGGAITRNMVRTAPLWGLRTRSHFMHDGRSATLIDAINRHGGQASASAAAFRRLAPAQRDQVLAFLSAL